MKYWIDTEFDERPGKLELISIGIVSEDGRDFYAESAEVNWEDTDPWVLENVRPHLLGNPVPRDQIREGILKFIGDDNPEFWAYYADYDWVNFCWLFGRMIDLPNGWPKLCLDLKQWAIDLGSPKLPEQTGSAHNALADARWDRDIHRFLDRCARSANS
jgi:hypothetical protein